MLHTYPVSIIGLDIYFYKYALQHAILNDT